MSRGLWPGVSLFAIPQPRERAQGDLQRQTHLGTGVGCGVGGVGAAQRAHRGLQAGDPGRLLLVGGRGVDGAQEGHEGQQEGHSGDVDLHRCIVAGYFC